MHAGDSVAPEEVYEFLFANRLYLARLNRFRSDFVGNISKHGTQSHHIAGSGNLQNHRLTVARRGGDLHLTKTDDEDIPRGVTLCEQFCTTRVAHHDSDVVKILEGFRREIAKHAEMTMLAVETIFRRVMRMYSGHTCSVVCSK